MNAAPLALERVEFRYPGGGFALSPADLEVRAGEVVGIIGPNGSGKTTLLRLASGGLSPAKGRVIHFGRDVRSLPRPEVARRTALITSTIHFEFPLTVREFVLQGRFPHLRGLRLPGRADLELGGEAMRRADVGGLADREVRSLSGGERQRVLLARALAQSPSLLLLDEPTANLDLGRQAEFLSLLRSLALVEGLGILWVSHDLNLASATCSRLVLLHRGTVRTQGLPEEVLTPGVLGEVFGARVLVDRHPETDRPRVTLGSC